MNKQRLTRLTRREKQAALTGGPLDGRIPDDRLRRRLADEGARTFDADAILAAVAREVGMVRLQAGIPRLKPSEIADQARDTVAAIDELLARLEHMHPELDCWANDTLFQARGEFAVNLSERMTPDLCRLRAALLSAARTIEGQATRGPKQNAWAGARDAIAAALREHSQPPVPVKAAGPLARELLELCGLPSPRKGR